MRPIFREEDGARILLCSEIGSEGRNFQFAHHLVLFDLPDEPGIARAAHRPARPHRADGDDPDPRARISRGTAGEVLARWYHEGLERV